VFRLAQQSILVASCVLLPCVRASAKPLHIERVTPACVAAARELEPRIEATLVGALQGQLEASVTIDAVEAGYHLTISLRDAARERGATTIETPTCEEAVDAAVVVLALAYGEIGNPETTPPASAPSQAMPERSPVLTRPTTQSDTLRTHDDPRAARDHTTVNGTERQTRLTLVTGVDRGTLPGPTLTLAGAVTRSFGALELAAVARYGLPIAEELVETGFSESQRHDFGGLELRACRGLGQATRLSACAGTEVGAVRARRSRLAEDGSELDSDQISPRLSGTLAALVARRGGLIEPALELAGAAVAVGRPAGAPWLSVRVAAGAAIAF
jgi:hypothetical protein